MALTFSIIIPSYNQPDFIEWTCLNLLEVKQKTSDLDINIEVLLFDSYSNQATQDIINKYKSLFNVLVIEKDKGQYDAINKGIERCTGEYWTWLNTDDLLDVNGFVKLVEIVKQDSSIDYIYGGIDYIDENNKFIKTYSAYQLNYETLYSHTPAIFQPGSFFKKSFTDKIGLLREFRCCFDYEYILRCFKNKAKIYMCDFSVAKFRYYKTSKTGSIIPVFIKEQLVISKGYGRKWFHFLTGFSYLRLLKHKFFPRK